MSNFIDTMQSTGLGEMIANSPYARYGQFTEDAALALNYVRASIPISFELAAVTWLNESTFRFCPPPNKNLRPGIPDDFLRWDVGPMQLNVWYTTEDIRVKFLSPI